VNFLYPLFLAGFAAIGLPIVLHMVRRRTRNRVTFSSLMFLRATLPRFRNRGRLEHLSLLILRCIVLCLLAFVFARPFFSRPAADSSAGAALGRRIVLLIDTSASMRRTGMWTQAVREARAVLDDTGPADRLCVMSFDQNTRIIMGFEQWETLAPARRALVAAEQISKCSPGWASTNLGQALVAAAEAIDEYQVNDSQSGLVGSGIHQLVLISDLQQGSNLEALQAYEWPKRTELAVRLVSCRGTTNAALQLVPDHSGLAAQAADGLPDIRITSSPDATEEHFHLSWADEVSASSPAQVVDIYVPPGRSVVMRAPPRANGSAPGKLILTGDDHDFDNILYLAPPLRQQVNIFYIGSEKPDDSKEMLYYVLRAFGAAKGALTSRVISRQGSETIAAADIESADMVIVADEVSRQNIVTLRGYLESGRTLLLALKSAAAVTTMAALAGIENLESAEADIESPSGRGYAMLSRIEFKHPLLTTFSEPRFGDFTRIHFWKYRRINIADCPGAQVLACFDSNDPALFEMFVGKGSLLVLTCGWHPSDSDLALSSKFVPLLYSILEYGRAFADRKSQYFVGDPVTVPDRSRITSESAIRIRKPDGSLILMDSGQPFTQTDMPGVYAIEYPNRNSLFAVNLPPQECRTAPMSIEDIDLACRQAGRLGVSFEQPSGVAVERVVQAEQHKTFAELENQQKIWRWAIIAVLAVLLVEIWLAGRLTRLAPVSQAQQLNPSSTSKDYGEQA
jgi:hypothetical protein